MIRPNEGLVDRLKAENENRSDGPQMHVRKGDKSGSEMPKSFRERAVEEASTSHQLTIEGFDGEGRKCNWKDADFTNAVSRAIRAAILDKSYTPRGNDFDLSINTNTNCVDGHRPAELRVSGKIDLSENKRGKGIKLRSEQVYNLEISLIGVREGVGSLLAQVFEKVSSAKNN